MATFLVLQQELADRLVAYDQTVSADATKLKRWLNLAQQYICGKRRWPFMLSSEIIQTVTDYTTGTASVAAGGTTVTFSAGIALAKQEQYIKFADSDNWYVISVHTAAASTATISPAALAANTSAAFTIRKIRYTTTVPIVQILDMKQLITPANLMSLSPWETDLLAPLYNDTGNPRSYIMGTPGSTSTPVFSFYPSPSTAMNIHIRGYKNLTDMSADGDISLIPVPWHDAMVNIAAFFGFTGLDDTRAQTELQAGELRIADMARNYSNDAGRHRVMASVDEQVSELGWNLPPYS